MTINQSAIDLLDQLDGVVEQLSSEQFSQPLEVLSHSSIGQHVRHTLEFFVCLMDARNQGKLNYDHRQHDAFIQTDPALARSVIRSIEQFLQNVSLTQSIILEASYGAHEEDLIAIPSSFAREVVYNIEHAIHHMALIKIGLRAHFPLVTMPAHFGVASSTVRYQSSQH